MNIEILLLCYFICYFMVVFVLTTARTRHHKTSYPLKWSWFELRDPNFLSGTQKFFPKGAWLGLRPILKFWDCLFIFELVAR